MNVSEMHRAGEECHVSIRTGHTIALTRQTWVSDI